MQKHLIISLVLLLSTAVVFGSSQQSHDLGANDRDGAACSMLVTIVKEYSDSHSLTYKQGIDGICGLIFQGHSILKFACDSIIEIYGRNAIKYLNQGMNPDQVCRAQGVDFCTKWPTCNLWSASSPPSHGSHGVQGVMDRVGTDFFSWLLRALGVDTVHSAHKPRTDGDHDLHSATDLVSRGIHWRGKDCNDKTITMRPGLKDSLNPDVDSNCNGISGRRSDRTPWKEVLCTDYYETVVFGDSMGARFSAPVPWFLPKSYDNDTFSNMLPRIEDELDLPHYSWVTGFLKQTSEWINVHYFGDPFNGRHATGGVAVNDDGTRYSRKYSNEREWQRGSKIPHGSINVDSFYLRYMEHNKCTHRQYQNCGVNGARIFDKAVLEAVEMNRNDDRKKFVVMEFLGNDVCTNVPGFDNMTTPDQFELALIDNLDYLNKNLPDGSKVVVFHTWDVGSLHWDFLWNKTHPLGMTYKLLFDYFNCLQISPCWGLMNSNETVRRLTNERGAQLNARITKHYESHKNSYRFQWDHYKNPAEEILRRFAADGGTDFGNLWEPVDGFHLNQVGHGYMGAILWDMVNQGHPDWLGPPNPNNKMITELFGDQGGLI